MPEANPNLVDAAARAATRAQTQTAIGLNFPVFPGITF
jgi:hypothetical protein